MIIGICGLIGSGKGTVADILVDTHGFEKISFADKLKDGVATIYGWDRDMLEGDTPESREWRETPDEFWTKETGEEITPRLVLQKFGTECMRQGFYDGIWVSLVKNKLLQNINKNYVIPDVRFYNELTMIKEVGGILIKVQRERDPEWWDLAVQDNRSLWSATPNSIVSHNMEDKFPEIHASEYKWVGWDFDYEIQNDSSIQHLTNQVLDLLDTNHSY